MKDCPFCRQPLDESNLEGPSFLVLSGPPMAPQGPKYDIRDAVTFTVQNIGTLSVLFQFIVGLIAAWKKPGIKPMLLLACLIPLQGCALQSRFVWPWQVLPADVPAIPAPVPSPPPASTPPTTQAPTPVPTPTPPPGPGPEPSPVPGPGGAVYPAKVVKVRVKIHTPADERPDGRAIMDGVALGCGPNADFAGRQCWPACGPEGRPNRVSCDQGMPMYWVGGLAHMTNPWLRRAAPGESVRACVGAEGTSSGTDVCSDAVAGQ